jgi:hypothetical protein
MLSDFVAGAFFEFNGPMGTRTKQLDRTVAKDLKIIQTNGREPLSGSGYFVTQMLMGEDEARIYVWDSKRGVTAIDAVTLQDLYSVNDTIGSSCFALDVANSSTMRVQVLLPNEGMLEVREYSMAKGGASQNKQATFRIEVDTWGKSSSSMYSASTCFAQNNNAPVFAAQAHDGAKITQLYSLDQTPPHNTLVEPPPGCNLNSTVGSPILTTGKDGVPLAILYMSCDSLLQNTLVAFPMSGKAQNKALQPAWTFAVGFLEVSFSDYTFRAAGNVLFWQNHDTLTVGAISTTDGVHLWSKPIANKAEGILSANANTALLFNYAESSSTVSALDAKNGTVRWSYPIRSEEKVLQQFGMFGPAGGVVLLLWGLSGHNTLIQLSSAGKELQVVDLGPSILPPNAADVLVTSDGGAIVYLGSPGRLVRLAGVAQSTAESAESAESAEPAEPAESAESAESAEPAGTRATDASIDASADTPIDTAAPTGRAANLSIESMWWPISLPGSTHNQLVCAKGSSTYGNASHCQDSCNAADACNAINFQSGHGEGPDQCFLLNCSFPQYPQVVKRGSFDYFSCAVYTADAPTPNPCGTITDRSKCNGLAYCSWCSSNALQGQSAQPGCDSWDPLVPKAASSACDKGPPVPPAPPKSCTLWCPKGIECARGCTCDRSGVQPVCKPS